MDATEYYYSRAQQLIAVLLVLIVIGWLQYSPAINIVRADVIKTRSRQTSLSEESDDERIGTTGRRPSRQSKREGEGEGEGEGDTEEAGGGFQTPTRFSSRIRKKSGKAN